jgi:hypothetical protein
MFANKPKMAALVAVGALALGIPAASGAAIGLPGVGAGAHVGAGGFPGVGVGAGVGVGGGWQNSSGYRGNGYGSSYGGSQNGYRGNGYGNRGYGGWQSGNGYGNRGYGGWQSGNGYGYGSHGYGGRGR